MSIKLPTLFDNHITGNMGKGPVFHTKTLETQESCAPLKQCLPYNTMYTTSYSVSECGHSWTWSDCVNTKASLGHRDSYLCNRARFLTQFTICFSSCVCQCSESSMSWNDTGQQRPKRHHLTFGPSEYSDQHAHSRNRLRIFTDHIVS